MSKPILYTFNLSVWSAVTDIARVELKLTDKVDTKTINVVEAENTSPDFIKIAPNATLPALAADGKTYGSTIESLEYLVKVSDVKVAPATELTTKIHEDSLDPNFMFLAARNDEELAAKAKGFQRILVATRLAKMQEYAASPEGAAFKSLYEARIGGHSGLLALYDGKAPTEAETGFFTASKANYDAARTFILETLPAAISTGPFVAGAEPGVDDFHIAGWLFHVGLCAGAGHVDEGLNKLEEWLGAEVPAKVRALWEAWTGREGWKSTYPDGALH
ncbi:hypothetical protein PENSPDRAFT_691305 [Peniophora sp. CONT]|nr:hypothetical protein PENSPDRAFT_691305 [Peniophora sp. CONT]